MSCRGIASVCIFVAATPTWAQTPARIGDCNHATTTAAVKDAIVNGLPRTEATPRIAEAIQRGLMTPSVRAVRTTFRDPNSSRRRCAAHFQVDLTDPFYKVMSKNAQIPVGMHVVGWQRTTGEDAIHLPISYDSQASDDGKTFAFGVSRLDDVLLAYMVVAAVAAKALDEPAAQPKPGAVPSAAGQACTGNETSTQELMECANTALDAADRALNDTYRTTMGKLPQNGKTALRQEQRAWITRRDRRCATKADDDVQGTAGELNRIGCLTTATEERTRELSKK